ncbi:hypothetical protein BM221_010521 [Beauveria bassiana]|uniref:Uncharacterized protein n=1 Tax=Beauveria bassiana TaxID=176275 RepID=A0A2N6N8M5_BEABA|nr:hypothetical protein BM221_010521 [Beauveria bassiana]
MISVDEKIEEEALMQMLQQIVETPEGALDNPSQSHLVMPAFSVWLQGDRIDMVWNEAAMGTCCKPEALPHHTSQDRMQPVLISV